MGLLGSLWELLLELFLEPLNLPSRKLAVTATQSAIIAAWSEPALPTAVG